MDFEVKLSQQAYDDIDSIIDYLSQELCNPQAAERFFDTINQKISLISTNPYMYPYHHDERLRTMDLRFVVIGKHLMFYLVDADNSVVNIVRVVYGGRDLSVIIEDTVIA